MRTDQAWFGLVALCTLAAGAAQGNPLVLLGHTSRVVSVDWSPDGKSLASWGDDNSVRIWDVAKTKEVAQFRGGTDKNAAIRWASWNADGTLIAYLASDFKLRVCEVKTEKELSTFDAEGKGVGPFQWHPDGKRIATVALATIDILDASTGKVERSWKTTGDPTRFLLWNPDGTRLATADESGRILIWDPKADKPLLEFEGQDNTMTTWAWNPDGKSLATGGYSKHPTRKDDLVGTAKVFNPETGKLLQTFRPASKIATVDQVGWSPDGKVLAVSDNYVLTVWNPVTNRRVWEYTAELGTFYVRFNWRPDGSSIMIRSDALTVLADGKTGRGLWVQQQRRVDDPNPGWPLIWRPDGLALAGPVNTQHPRYGINVWEMPKPKK
jgi:WD40 repeat protein